MPLQPIKTAPRNGRVICIGDKTGNVAKAFWHKGPQADEGKWVYVAPYGYAWLHQIDFEPTDWSHNLTDFNHQVEAPMT